jgi:hypothetical protein
MGDIVERLKGLWGTYRERPVFDAHSLISTFVPSIADPAIARLPPPWSVAPLPGRAS